MIGMLKNEKKEMKCRNYSIIYPKASRLFM